MIAATSTPGPRRVRVRASDGRQLDVLVSGEDGLPLVLHHGTAGANTQFAPWVQAALSRGLRLVTYSRPGYGSSDRAEGRTVGDCAADVERILDELGARVCVTVGPSGGGPHALAVAALLPHRTLACATVGGLAPFGVEDLDWFAEMGRDLVTTYSLAAASDDAGLIGFVERYRSGLVRASPLTLFDTRMPLAPVDLQAIAGNFGRYLVRDAREALRSGVWGWFDDALAFTRPWGFDVGEISIPVTVWQGGVDRMVPPGHGAWLASHIPGATAQLRPEHGHMSLAVGGFEEVIDFVSK